ncbi:RagB/SusD family nutrient uptake outer membrane protein [Sphingobacterium sp. lm-10]|uniref:RagB/SusD family nutrient uptake outer membrane protein n=1 Tax=Sphingobacterium sp. lm-10 TaxID=2944904 RepID=UPI0020228C88|nr:RagB/SusD family nutrient uptake outer membrane protein [Sphingobacterium sp. lm-10]MCL7986559.1 RagB/SusD family nutrient uptake outer membrane protein [Sphingobacterium sp. lm-10]
MKTKLIYIASAALLFTSCSKWLDKDPIGILTQEEVQVDPTEGTITTGVLFAYRPLSNTLNIFGDWDWTGGLVIRPDFILEDIASGDAQKKWVPDGDQAWMDDVANYNFTAENGAFAGIWRFNYDGIARVNIAIFQLTDPETLGKLNISDERRKQLLGESSFLRAFYYFDLVKYFGDVPMVLQPLENFNEAYEVAVRMPKSDVYAQVKADLAIALENLPAAKYSNMQERWRASQGAALALNAKVALFEGDWNAVIDYANRLEQTGFYGLNPNFFDAFDNEKAYQEQENIFIYDHETGLQPPRGNGLAALMGWGFLAPSANLLQSFETGDPRLSQTANVSSRSIYKLLGAQNDTFKGNENSPVNRVYIRYADVLLWKAEAFIETNRIAEGVAIINLIRQRARGGQSVLPDRATDATKEEATAWLRQERRVELSMESHRLSDLRRWKVAKTTLNQIGKPYLDMHDLFPIPQGDVDKTAGKIVQNPGY